MIKSIGRVEEIWKTAEPTTIINFYRDRLRAEFADVADPGYLYSGNKLLFVLFFASSNPKKAALAVKIANGVIQKLAQL
jgi:hypothetical protein